MASGLKRTDLQKLSQAMVDDATLLFESKRYSGAYYLAGYAVEFALKACIAKQMVTDVIPDKAFISAIYTHSLKALIGSAGLNQQLKEMEDKDSAFAANFAIVAEWDPQTRYETKDSYSAQILLAAITDPKSGVLTWIKAHW